MLSVIYLSTIVILAVLSLTRRRILIICGFYCIYGVLKVVGQGDALDWSQLLVFRALYPVLFISVLARFMQDHEFLRRIRSWPLVPYLFLLVIFFASAIYSRSSVTFSSSEPGNLWNQITVFSLFWLASSQIHEERDLQTFALATVCVSLALSAWVIWSLAQLNFTALRGGIEVNQNYVSVFVLAGVFPLVNSILVTKSRLLKGLCFLVLLVVMQAALTLASRGMIAAVFAGVTLMAVRAIRGMRLRTILIFGTTLTLLIVVVLSLPGVDSFAARFQEGDLGTLNDRTLIWSYSLRYFADSSIPRMLFGQGFSSGPVVLNPVVSTTEVLNYHNEYLRWLMDQGVVGLIAFLAFLYSMVRRVLGCSHPLKNVMLGWLAFLMVAGLTSTLMDHLFWILLGGIAAASAITAQPQRRMLSRQTVLFPDYKGGQPSSLPVQSPEGI